MNHSPAQLYADLTADAYWRMVADRDKRSEYEHVRRMQQTVATPTADLVKAHRRAKTTAFCRHLETVHTEYFNLDSLTYAEALLVSVTGQDRKGLRYARLALTCWHMERFRDQSFDLASKWTSATLVSLRVQPSAVTPYNTLRDLVLAGKVVVSGTRAGSVGREVIPISFIEDASFRDRAPLGGVPTGLTGDIIGNSNEVIFFDLRFAFPTALPSASMGAPLTGGESVKRSLAPAKEAVWAALSKLGWSNGVPKNISVKSGYAHIRAIAKTIPHNRNFNDKTITRAINDIKNGLHPPC